jgi:hypothetical protein
MMNSGVKNSRVFKWIRSAFLVSFLGVIGLALSVPSSAERPDSGSTVPCGTSAQCASNTNSCPANEGWIHLPPDKWVKCCRLASGSQSMYWYWLKIRVFNKMPPAQGERCYRLLSWVQGSLCNPQDPCVDDTVPGEPGDN